MARIMIQGTASSVGKSLICAGLCRLFKEEGFQVYPFKSQNMSSLYYVNDRGHKISASQSLQALACGRVPEAAMNPILLIPQTDEGSRVVILGEEQEPMQAREYFSYRKALKSLVEETYKREEALWDIMVIEGAGSPAEINLKENDIVNMGMAQIADAPVLLVGDIDKGGVFASFYGTLMLLDPEERARVKGLIINKFRGDKALLEPGIKMIEELLGIPVVGTIPYLSLEWKSEVQEVTKGERVLTFSGNQAIEKELDRLALCLRENLELSFLYGIMGLDAPGRKK